MMNTKSLSLKILLTFVGLFYLLFFNCSEQKTISGLLITNITIIDASDSIPRSNMAIIIKDSTISQVIPMSKLTDINFTKVIDAKGKFAIPGLWDMHIHLSKSKEGSLAVLLANGITSARDMGGNLHELQSYQRKIESKRIKGPRLKISGPMIESPESYKDFKKRNKNLTDTLTRLVIAKPEEALPKLKQLTSKNIDFIKIRNYASSEVYYAIADAAAKLNIKFSGHPPWGIDPIDAAKARQASFEHAFYPYPLSNLDSIELNNVISEFIKNEVYLVPTLSAWMPRTVDKKHAKSIIYDSTNTLDYRTKYVSKYLITDWKEQIDERDSDTEEGLESWTQTINNAAKDIGKMHKSGVKVMAGTDLAVTLVYPGFSLHDELELLVSKVGMSPLEAITAATFTPAKFFEIQDQLGTIEKGKIADILLLDKNPLENISNTKKINTVIYNGTLYTKESIASLLQSSLNN